MARSKHRKAVPSPAEQPAHEEDLHVLRAFAGSLWHHVSNPPSRWLDLKRAKNVLTSYDTRTATASLTKYPRPEWGQDLPFMALRIRVQDRALWLADHTVDKPLVDGSISSRRLVWPMNGQSEPYRTFRVLHWPEQIPADSEVPLVPPVDARLIGAMGVVTCAQYIAQIKDMVSHFPPDIHRAS